MAGVTLGRVTGRTIEANRDSDGSKRMIQVEVSDPEDIQDAQQVTQAGEDSSPPDGSLVAIIDVSSAFRLVVAADDGITPTVNPGEKEIYSSAAGEKLATLLLDIIGNLVATPSLVGTVQLAGNARNASGVDDTITITQTTDPDLFVFLTAVGAPVGAVPPSSITGKITSGAPKVRLP